jgi:hypothetical protein
MSPEEPGTGGTRRPRGLLSRCVLAAAIFVAAVLPGWLLADTVDDWTRWRLLGWMCSGGWTAAFVRVLAPRVSYRGRDAVLGGVPVYGWYLACVLAWRAALLPLRDWEPRPEEMWRARWLTGVEYAGLWRADRRRLPDRTVVARPVTPAPAAARRPAVRR